MTAEKLLETLQQHIIQKSCFTTEVRDVLMAYKEAGGQQEIAQQILAQLKQDHQDNDSVQDCIDDILDMVTGWCTPDMKVW
ncbi:hypothetical protein SAMN04488128_10427 [Chitinophaga eiseniae]|uniref:Uncharacterized protein n=1 Tax=Chitinophaga eiseniae TaxID=634771 RepID=A0A1T4T6T9_9BACT|nr:hypothetical protein [Chitinophaga eiseniae]SKA35951.1 hypothetical protein SAMN04488128_10427 [Chitinophaga eiseniae]